MKAYRAQVLHGEDYRVTAWSGGKTTELSIEPRESIYADRDFLWRLSSATVELEESDFTSLPDYDRIIMTLQGSIELRHNGGGWLELQEYEPYSFDGADDTQSIGKVVDFNLMLRKGKVTGEMRAIRLGSGGQQRITPEMPGDTVLLYLAEGTARVRAAGGMEL